MNFSQAVKTCFAKYFTFSGRASRSEYWFIILFFWLLMFVTAIIDIVVFPNQKYMVINLIANLLIVIPSISVAARRLHDVGRSGWWQLLYITIVGAILLLYWFIKKGDAGDNKHGSNPLQTLPE